VNYNLKSKILNCLAAVFLLLANTAIHSQQPKGVITTNETAAGTGKTRALVIGISRYQFIDTLNFADADASFFATYLKTSKFWNIDPADITVLLNDQAKYGDLTVQLQQISMQCQPGDNLIFYFSGHGDVETNTLFNRGFLLAQDTYSSNYMANGLRVDDLKDLFVTLQTNNVKVIVITDACRSGKLSGGIKGAEFTAAAIKNIWKNEIKILSSQPGQLSYEDQKWGNGRGVFSYFLIKGLSGEADANKDSTITLAELEMYVGSNVANETGYKQQPIFEGPNKFSSVISATGLRTSSGSKKAGNASRIPSEQLLQSFDSCIYYYDQMEKAIRDNKLVSPKHASAGYYYQRLKSCSNDIGFVQRANGRILAALMNKSQETVNHSFIGKKLVTDTAFREAITLINEMFRLNEIKLPNLPHWRNLQRYLYVMGESTWNDKSNPALLRKIIDSAAAEEPDAAYLFTATASVEMRRENWDAAIGLLESAIAKSPGWLIPKYYLGICYANRRNYKKALLYYEQVIDQDSTYKTFECTKCILLNMAQYAFSTRQFNKGLNYLYRSIDLFPDYWAPYEVLYTYAVEKKDSVVAREFIERSQRFDSTVSMEMMLLRFRHEYSGQPISYDQLTGIREQLKDNTDSADFYYTLGLYYSVKENYDRDSVSYCFYQAARLDSSDAFLQLQLIKWLVEEEEYEEAEDILLQAIPRFSDEEKGKLQEQLANIYLDTERYAEAFSVCRDLVQAGYLFCSDLQKMKKAFKGLKEYETYMKNCKEDN
jgi:tetratricopeptide (TPR) repeat protein